MVDSERNVTLRNFTSEWIYDWKNKQWYKISRNFFGELKLQKITYTNLVRCVGPNELIVKNGKLRHHYMPEPKTPEPCGN